MAKVRFKVFCAVLLASAQVSAATAQTATVQTATVPRTSSERIVADPAGQYLLIKTLMAQRGIAGRPNPLTDPEGYDLLGYCWTPAAVLGDWAERSGLAGRMIVMALETRAWARDLGRGGYPAAPLTAAIGNYEVAMIAAGLADSARERALDALLSELATAGRTAPGAIKARRQSGCQGHGATVQLRHRTVPKEGRAWFVARPLHEICRAQQLDADDFTRCDYWAAAREAEPLAFAGEIAWLARWPDDTVARGTFDSRTAGENGIVTLRDAGPRK